MIAQNGWEDASIDEITREAGVSRGLVSYHFRDKAQLLSDVLTRCRDTFRETVRSAVVGVEGSEARMRAAIRASLAYTREDPTVYTVFLDLVTNARTNPELSAQVRDLYAEFREMSAKAIRRGQERGVFRPDIDPVAAATRQNAAITGFALQWLLERESFNFDETARQTEEMILLYLTGGAAPAHGVPGGLRALSRA